MMKKQSRKVGVAGGFINQMMGNNSTTPKVGEGATILMYSDRESYDHLYENPNADNFYNQKKLINGVTKQYKNFNKVSIIFGVMEQYRDPHF